jgi:phage regulator Rha-like protein
MKKEFEQHMTSIEIAEITNQKHKDLMKDIKKLEPEWVKEHGSGFILETFKDENGKTQSCYSLTKQQSYFIARKLAIEAFSIFL